MTKELVQIDQRGQITWATAVGRVADALNPLGHVARIVSELNACLVDHRRMDLAVKKVQVQREIIQFEMREQWLYRHRRLTVIFEGHREQMRESSVLSRRLGQAYDAAVMMSVNPAESEDVRLLSQQTTLAMGAQMLTLHGQRGDMLVGLARVFQVGVVTPNPNLWRALES